VRQSIRGYTDGVVELTGTAAELASTSAELEAVQQVVDASEDLRHVLADSGVSASARRAVVTELFQNRVGARTLDLLIFVTDADRAAEFPYNLGWLAARVDAAARGARPVSETVLGRHAAEERLDGFATAILGPVPGESELTRIEDELFRFMRIVDGSPELSNRLSDPEVPADTRRSLVEDLLRPKADPITLQLAAYATRVGRPRDYQALLGYLVDRVASESNRRLAEVRAPVDLDETQRQHLADALARVVGRGVEIRVTIDPSVLAGFVATIGDTVVDGSARHRLEILKERLLMPEAAANTTTRGNTGDS
jgi:F-type H+-transporting ATPase subunit delta